MKPIKSPKLRKSANGKSCTMRVPGICDDSQPGSVVVCHVSTKRSSSMGGKNHDNFSFDGCYSCHQWQEDNRYSHPEAAQWALEAMDETNQRRIAEGLIKCT